MRYQVDQSGRIEETNRDTIIGIASKKNSFTLRISARLKRQLLEIFRRQGKPKVFPMVVFGIVVGLAIKRSKFNVSDLDIDIEYPSHNHLIKGFIGSVVEKEISYRFKSIGKKSKAHYVAYGVFMGRKRADTTLGLRDIIRYLE